MVTRYPIILQYIIDRYDYIIEAYGLYNRSSIYIYLKEIVEDRLLKDSEVEDLLKKHNVGTAVDLESFEEVYVDDFTGQVYEYGTRVYDIYTLNFFQRALFELDKKLFSKYKKIQKKIYSPIFKLSYNLNSNLFWISRRLIRLTKPTYTVSSKEVLIISKP